MARNMLTRSFVLVCSWVRRFIAAAMIGLLISSTASVALTANTPDVCERDHHNCDATLQANCCPVATPATPANVAIAQSVTTVIKMDHATVAWLDLIAGSMTAVERIGRHVVAAPFSSPPRSPLSDSLVSLLI